MDSSLSYSARFPARANSVPQWHQSGFKSGGIVDPGRNKLDFFKQISENNSIFYAISLKHFEFPGKFPKNFDFFKQFQKEIAFPGKNGPFTATSGQIILFLFKSHHF